MPRKPRPIVACALLAASFSASGAVLACGTSSDATATNGESTVESALETSCAVTSPTTCTMPAPHYADITPILQKSCNPCHIGGVNGPWPLTDYADVAAWAGTIQQDLSACAMPPLDGGVAMTAVDRLEILNWIVCGDMQ